VVAQQAVTQRQSWNIIECLGDRGCQLPGKTGINSDKVI
jgi:hypothetical protein